MPYGSGSYASTSYGSSPGEVTPTVPPLLTRFYSVGLYVPTTGNPSPQGVSTLSSS